MNKNDIATLVKSKRLNKGLTQQEVADLAKISLRSLQRIEKAEVVPRMYTMKDLAAVLDFDVHKIFEATTENGLSGKWNNRQRRIITIGAGLFLVLVMLGYMAQSPIFPETYFEGIMSFTALIVLYSGFLLWFWRTDK